MEAGMGGSRTAIAISNWVNWTDRSLLRQQDQFQSHCFEIAFVYRKRSLDMKATQCATEAGRGEMRTNPLQWRMDLIPWDGSASSATSEDDFKGVPFVCQHPGVQCMLADTKGQPNVYIGFITSSTLDCSVGLNVIKPQSQMISISSNGLQIT